MLGLLGKVASVIAIATLAKVGEHYAEKYAIPAVDAYLEKRFGEPQDATA